MSKVRSDAVATHDDVNDRNERTPASAQVEIVAAVVNNPRTPGGRAFNRCVAQRRG